MGLRIDIYHTPSGDFTNGGVSASATTGFVVNLDGGLNTPIDGAALLMVVPGAGRRAKILVPAALVDGEYVPLQVPGSIGPMFGGNFGYTSDSRFGGAAIHIHDRFETAAQYRALSI